MGEKEKKPLKIVRLETSNVMAIKAAEIDADGHPVIVIGGENGQGKSSLMNSIAMAIGGKRLQPPRPLRDGASKGEVTVNLGDMTIRRTFTPGGGTLTVTGTDGAKYPSPQALLDKLTGELTFDPLEFARTKPREQVETLRRLTGIDIDAFEAERKKVYEERTAINRMAKELRGRLSELTIAKDAPEEEIDVAALMEELKARREVLEQGRAHRRDIAEASRDLQDLIERRIAAEKAVIEIQKLITAKQSELEKMQKVELVYPDTTDIEEQIARASELNRMVSQNRRAREVLEEAEAKEHRVGELTKALATIDKTKAEVIAAAKLPVKGLSFNADGITFRDVPFEQCSTSEQLKVSVALGLALNPDIRVLLIRDGSLLDTKSMETITKLAIARDAQIWIERVGQGEEVSVVIEHGVVSEDRTKVEV